MEQVQVVHVQIHVHEEHNIVQHEQVVVVQYQHDTIQQTVIVREINVQDRVNVHVETIVQMVSVMDVEKRNIILLIEQQVVVMQIQENMQNHLVVRVHVQISRIIQVIQVMLVVIVVVGHVFQVIIQNEVIVFLIVRLLPSLRIVAQ